MRLVLCGTIGFVAGCGYRYLTQELPSRETVLVGKTMKTVELEAGEYIVFITTEEGKPAPANDLKILAIWYEEGKRKSINVGYAEPQGICLIEACDNVQIEIDYEPSGKPMELRWSLTRCL